MKPWQKEGNHYRSDEKVVLIGAKKISRNKRSRIILLVFLLVALTTSVLVHLYDSTHPFFDYLAEKRISEAVYKNVEQTVIEKYEKRGLPESLARVEIEREVRSLLERPEIDAAMLNRAEQYRDVYRDPAGTPYLAGADPYFFVIEAKNVLRYGHTGEIVKKGVSYNTLRYPPSGTPSGKNLLSYLEAGTYSFMNLFTAASLENVAYYIPLLFAALSVILIFFIGKAASNVLGGFFAAMLFAIHPVIRQTTALGFADTNSLNIMFTLLIVFLTVHLVRQVELRKPLLNKILPAAAIMISIILFWLNWKGYYYIVLITFLSLVIHVLNRVLMNKRFVRYRGQFIILAFLITLTAAVFFVFFTTAFDILMMRLHPLPDVSFFPDATTTVIELQRISLAELMPAAGSMIFIIAMACACYLTYMWISRFFSRKTNFNHILFSTWFFLLIIATFFAKRFLPYLLIVLCILVGIILCRAPRPVRKILKSLDLPITKRTSAIITIIIVMGLFFFSVKGSLLDDTELKSKLVMNDAIYDSAQSIKHAADDRSILFSWWDYGYLYQHYAEIPTLFDGGLFHKPRLYWFSSALMSDKETRSVNTLRMLACDGNGAFDSLSESMGDLEAMELLDKSLHMEEKQARILLADNGADDEVVDGLFCDRPTDFVVVSDDMALLLNTISFFADWNFQVAAIAPELKQLSAKESKRYLADEYNLSDAEYLYDTYLRMLEGAPDNADGLRKLDGCSYGPKSILCNGLPIIDLDKNFTTLNGEPVPYIVSLRNMSRISPDIPSNHVLIAYETENGIRVLLRDRQIAESLFVKLLYLDGAGLKHFRKLSESEYPFARRVIVYQVVYDPEDAGE